MTDEQSAKLRELAEQAREAEAAYVAAQAGPSRVDERRAEYAHDNARDELYAAASPATILALLDERDALRIELDKARERSYELLRAHDAQSREIDALRARAEGQR